MKTVMIINGPNLNLLGVREPEIYGKATLDDIRRQCEAHAASRNVAILFHQSNHEGEIVELIQSARDRADAIIINPAGFSFSSVAIVDALRVFDGPIVEVHLSNIHRRDEIHRHSIVSSSVTGVICGLGPAGYVAALGALADLAAPAG